MGDANATKICLSQEELLFILRKILGAKGLPGASGLSLDRISNETEALLLDAAGRALIARGIIAIGKDDSLRIDKGVRAIVSACVHPEQMIAIVFKKDHNLAHQNYFYRVPEFAVTHSFPLRGLHNFEIDTTSDMGVMAITQLLQELPENEVTASRYTLGQLDIARVQEIASQDNEAAITHLANANMASAHAQSLVKALSAPVLRLALQFIYQVTSTVEQKLFTLVADKAGCWLFEADGPEADNVTVQSLSAERALKVILEAHCPFRQPLATG